MSSIKISGYNLQRISLELPLPIGDSQVRFSEHWMTIVELSTDTGLTGLGFELQQGMPIAARPRDRMVLTILFRAAADRVGE